MIILVGKSCSGKDTVVKELAKMGYNKIVTCTTRPPRPGEIDGREYHFLNKMKTGIRNIYELWHASINTALITLC